MELKDIDREFNLLSEYMDMYIQIAKEFIDGKKRHSIPTFNEFKDDYIYYTTPSMKDTKYLTNDGRIAINYANGLGVEDSLAYRYYKIVRCVKYFTNGNINGDYTVSKEYAENKINKHLKRL